MSPGKSVTWIVLASALMLLACDREKGSAQNQPASTPALQFRDPCRMLHGSIAPTAPMQSVRESGFSWRPVGTLS